MADRSASVPARNVGSMRCVEIVGGNVRCSDAFWLGGLEVLLVARPVGGGGGGDVYCIHSCGHGSLAKFVLLDLAGHGQERDNVAQSVHTLLHHYGGETRPAPLLTQLNRRYKAFVFPSIYSTVVSATYHHEKNEFRFANAGQPRPICWSAERPAWSVVQPAEQSDCGLPLGIQGEACYTEESILLGEHDVLFFASDGLPEVRNQNDDFLEPEGVLKLLAGASTEVREHSALSQLAEAFLRRVEEFQGKKDFDDDVTLLWMRRLPDATKIELP